jgi:hypothetical protein
MQIAYRFFTFIALLSILSGCFATKEQEIFQPFEFVNQHGQVCPEILKVLDLTNIQTNGTLSDIVAKTQASWLRKPGTERWEMDTLITQHDTELKKLFHDMNMYDEVKPTKHHYTYLLMLGALFKTMDQRFAYAIELYKSGIRFDNIVLLAGKRPCFLDHGENIETFLKYSKLQALDKAPQTEADILQFIYDHANMPDQMRQIPVQVIAVPMQTTASGKLTRPTTADTFAAWMQTNPTPGNCLAISNQPYVGYQHTMIKTLLPSDFSIETAGAASSQNEEIAVILDTLARILYQEQQRPKTK